MPESQLSIAKALQQGITQLKSSESAKLDSEILLLKVLNNTSKPLLTSERPVTKTWLLTWPEKRLTIKQSQQFNHYLQLRLTGMPIAYITGEKDFWTFTLDVTSDTLIPRPESELLVDYALEKIPSTKKVDVLDLGTGSGAIALAIASERKNCQVLATDISQAALNIAQKNADKLKIANITFLKSHWFNEIDSRKLEAKKFDIIVSNPPYIAADDPLLEENVRKFEPTQALISSSNGLDDISQIIPQSLNYLKPQGWILFEHGHEQADIVQSLLQKHCFTQITTINDLNHYPRVTLAQFNPS